MAKFRWLATALLPVLFGSILFGGILVGCGDGDTSNPPEAALPPGQTLTLRTMDIADMKPVSGEITTRDMAAIPARIAGTLTELSVREGDLVKKGQRLGKISDTRLGYEASAFEAQAKAAEAEAARAIAELARVQDLYDNGVYAKARLEQAVAAARAAEAQAAAARAQKSASLSVVEQGIILAPANGRVLRADVPAGSVVTPGMTVMVITAGPPVLRLELPESLAERLSVGAQVTVTDKDFSGPRQGQVTEIYPAIRNGRVTVDASLPELAATKVGRRVGVSIEIGKRRGISIPRSFVSTRYGIDYVDVVTARSHRTAVPVQTAPAPDPALVEILSGVTAGDTLFRAGKGT